MTDNREQIEYWNGAGGARWVTHQEALDRMVGPFGAAAIARLAPRAGERVLDVGCGCGDSALALLEAVGPAGAVTGVDLSAPMLERARARVSRPNARFVAADAAEQTWPSRFDALYSRFGVMFFADPVAAFRRLRAALVPGPRGRIAFVCWRGQAENTWGSVPFAAVRGALPDAPIGVQDRSAGPGPFAFADRELVARTLAQAGFTAIDLAPFDHDVELASTGLDDAVHFALTAGPAARLLAQATPQERERAAAHVAEALSPHLVGERVVLRGAAWIAFAQNA